MTSHRQVHQAPAGCLGQFLHLGFEIKPRKPEHFGEKSQTEPKRPGMTQKRKIREQEPPSEVRGLSRERIVSLV